jgi:hypothetical protein
MFKLSFSENDISFPCLDLRKQARKLENEIDLKLVAYSKLGTNSPVYRNEQ